MTLPPRPERMTALISTVYDGERVAVDARYVEWLEQALRQAVGVLQGIAMPVKNNSWKYVAHRMSEDARAFLAALPAELKKP